MNQIYRTSFFIGKKGKRPKLEEIVDIMHFWASKKAEGKKVLKFEKDEQIQEMGRDVLRTIRISEGEKEYFGMSYEHPDRQERAMNWKVTFAVEDSPETNPKAEICVLNVNTSGILNPTQFIKSRPNFVPHIIKTLGAHMEYPLTTTPKIIRDDSGEIGAFLSMIENSERKLPMVYISATRDDNRNLVNPETIAMGLAGTAHILYSENKFVSLKIFDYLREKFGKDSEIVRRLGCYNGAVKIYWPSQKGTLESVFSNFWLPQRIIEEESRFEGNVSREIIESILKHSLSFNSLITFDRIKEIHLKQKIIKLQEQEDLPQLVELYSKENRELKENIKNLKEENQNMQEDITELNLEIGEKDEKIGDLERNIGLANSELAKTYGEKRKLEDYIQGMTPKEEIKSMKDAYAYFKKLPCSERIIFTSKAEKSAVKSLFTKPEMFLRALQFLSNEFIEAKTGIRKVPDLELLTLQTTGMDYSPHQSPITIGEHPENYQTIYKERKIILENHLSYGISRNERESLRIAFEYLTDENIILIGYIGQHQKNRAS